MFFSDMTRFFEPRTAPETFTGFFVRLGKAESALPESSSSASTMTFFGPTSVDAFAAVGADAGKTFVASAS